MRVKAWLSLVRTGDWIVLASTAAFVAASFPLLWRTGPATYAEVRAEGQLIARLPLTERRLFVVRGPLGVTTIEIAPGRARILSDPGPRQYCVAQGWLVRPNAIALCAPNHVSLRLTGPTTHDSVNY
ncbi:MAG: NusG domain II-containing protein [Rhodocyclaceae bacterium]|nr:NusG domain II-containing protein [Rhodocyclaceae bacterium]